jgi:hypothetical protein
MLRRSFLGLLGISLFGFLPKHLQLPGQKMRQRRYYVGKQYSIYGYAKHDIIDGKKVILFKNHPDHEWIITHVEC